MAYSTERKASVIGLNLAKRILQVREATMAGKVKFREKLTRDQFRAFMVEQPAALLGV